MSDSPGSDTTADTSAQQASVQTSRRLAMLEKYRWLTFVLPLAVFMIVNSLEPKPPKTAAVLTEAASDEPIVGDTVNGETAKGDAGDALDNLEGLRVETPPAETGYLPYRYYPLVYTLKIALTVAAMWLVWPGYREFPWRLSPLAIGVGCLGAAVWIGLCKLSLEARVVQALGLEGTIPLGERSAFNPLAELAATPLLAAGFLAVRFFGLCCVVPVIEEFFLRGFVMRFVMHADWWQVPFGSVNLTAILVGTAVPLMMHVGGEMLAAVVWFSLVTWLMVRTRNIWDCVAAHAVTNLLLGVYVVFSGDWWMM